MLSTERGSSSPHLSDRRPSGPPSLPPPTGESAAMQAPRHGSPSRPICQSTSSASTSTCPPDMATRGPFTTITTEGGLLPADLLSLLTQQPDLLPGTTARGLPPRPRPAAARSHQPVLDRAAGRLGSVPDRACKAPRRRPRHQHHARTMAPAPVRRARLRAAAQSHRHQHRRPRLPHLPHVGSAPDPPARRGHRTRPAHQGRRRGRRRGSAFPGPGTAEPFR